MAPVLFFLLEGAVVAPAGTGNPASYKERHMPDKLDPLAHPDVYEMFRTAFKPQVAVGTDDSRTVSFEYTFPECLCTVAVYPDNFLLCRPLPEDYAPAAPWRYRGRFEDPEHVGGGPWGCDPEPSQHFYLPHEEGYSTVWGVTVAADWQHERICPDYAHALERCLHCYFARCRHPRPRAQTWNGIEPAPGACTGFAGAGDLAFRGRR
jgi:hypothetical protein